LNDTGEKNAPSLAARGKSTFSEGGGDKRFELSNKKARLFEILHKKIAAVQHFYKGFTIAI